MTRMIINLFAILMKSLSLHLFIEQRKQSFRTSLFSSFPYLIGESLAFDHQIYCCEILSSTIGT